MSPKVTLGGFSCEYDIDSSKNMARIHCVSQQLGVPYLCILDDFGRVKKEIGGSFGMLRLDSKQIPKLKEICILNGFEGEVTIKRGIDTIKSVILNAINNGLNLVLG